MTGGDSYTQTPDGRVRVPGDLPEARHCDGTVFVSWRNKDVELCFTQAVESPLTRKPAAVAVARIFLSPDELEQLALRLLAAAEEIRNTPQSRL